MAVLLPDYIKSKVVTIPKFLELRCQPAARMRFSGLMVFVAVVTRMAFTFHARALAMRATMGGM